MANPRGRYLVAVANTKSSRGGLEGVKGPGRESYFSHAYRIKEVSLDRGEVVLSNPHDTSKEEVIHINEFTDYFLSICAVKQRNDSQKAIPIKEHETRYGGLRTSDVVA